ncbi:pirin family protein [Leeia sp. TBRC 13508]|uniref:Pirin family protein n=1 Tax=Leeia speluncae TaxID=2884804 RepID=A0ABS8D574_9NEIS|nr:pirin family protein [Leeia speluncae]MCB6183148.1 pirin family protein [Leeia speluncae]
MSTTEFEHRPANERGIADFGWLHSKHTFSFGHYRDLNQRGFSDLLVINDDTVHGGGGFPTHPHRDMEIFSYVLSGALAHKDSMGNGSVIVPGDVQMMSAGTGIRHSEYNHSDTADVHFLQIWIVPNQESVTPRYQQVNFSVAEKRGKLRTIISPEGENGSLSVYQDAKVLAGLFDGDESATYQPEGDRHVYIHVAQGEVTVNGNRMVEGDGARLRHAEVVELSQGKGAEVLLFDLRPNEYPSF